MTILENFNSTALDINNSLISPDPQTECRRCDALQQINTKQRAHNIDSPML